MAIDFSTFPGEENNKNLDIPINANPPAQQKGVDFSTFPITDQDAKVRDSVADLDTAIEELQRTFGPGSKMGGFDKFLQTVEVARLPANFLRERLQKLNDALFETPEEVNSPSAVVNFVRGTPKVLAEVISEFTSSFIDPETLALGALGRVMRVPGVRQGAKDVAKGAVTLGKKVTTPRMQEIAAGILDAGKKLVTYKFGRPELFKQMSESSIAQLARKSDEVMQLVKPIFKMNVAQQRQAAAFIKGEIDTLPPAMLKNVRRIRTAFTDLGMDLVDLGLLEKATFEANVKTYLPRLFRSKEAAKRGVGLGKSRFSRAALDRLKKRKDLPEEMKEALGEILELGYPSAKGLLQLNNLVTKHKMFRAIAKQPEWLAKNAKAAALNGFKKLEGTKQRFGDLAGKWVHPAIADDITQMTKIRGPLEKLWLNFISKWKFGKTVANPATHFRNMLSNVILADMGGTGFTTQARLWRKAYNDVRKKTKMFRLAQENGGVGVEFVGTEIGAFNAGLIDPGAGGIVKQIANRATRGAQWAGNVYQGEEQVWKMIKFRHGLENGMTPAQAGADAAKWLFDYTKVSPLVDFLRKAPLGSPFVTFTSKVLPRLMEVGLRNPLKLYKYKLFFDAVEDVAQERLGISDDQRQTIKDSTRGLTVMLPIRDQNKNPLVMDLSYILPWGDLGESGGMFGLPSVVPPSGPVKAFAEVGMNKSTFLDRPIWKETDTPGTKISKASDFLFKALLPSWTPGLGEDSAIFKGGFSWEKLVSAVQKRPDYAGNVREPMLVALDIVAGIKLFGKDPEMLKFFEVNRKRKQASELQRGIRSIMRNQGISDVRKGKELDKYISQMDKLWKE